MAADKNSHQMIKVSTILPPIRFLSISKRMIALLLYCQNHKQQENN
jgi:hypothetical protein